MIELLDFTSISIQRRNFDLPENNLILSSISASSKYTSVDYSKNNEITSSISLPSAPYPINGVETEFKDIWTKVISTEFLI